MANPNTIIYGLMLKSMGNGRINFDTHTFMGMLCGPGYVPSQSAHQFKSSVTSEITGSGYNIGGKAIAISTSYSNKTFTVMGSNLVWPSAKFSARYLVVYDDSASPNNNAKPLICCIDFGEMKVVNDQSFEWRWASGVILSVSMP